jgi:hypothetical protein
MRTTLTIDEDVAAKLKSEVQKRGLPFKQIVNETLRRGLLADLAGLLLGTFPTFGFLGQRYGQSRDLLLNFRVRRLRLLDLGFEFAYFDPGALLLRLEFLLCLLKFLLQFRLRLLARRQISLQFTLAFRQFGDSSLGRLPTLGLSRQRFLQTIIASHAKQIASPVDTVLPDGI